MAVICGDVIVIELSGVVVVMGRRWLVAVGGRDVGEKVGVVVGMWLCWWRRHQPLWRLGLVVAIFARPAAGV